MSPIKPKSLRRPPTLRQLADRLESEEFECLGHPHPRCRDYGELPQHDHRRTAKIVRRALRTLDTRPFERSYSSDDMIERLKSIARNACCTNHRLEDNHQDFAYYWLGADTLDYFLRSRDWPWDMDECYCLGSMPARSCLLLKQKWSVSDRDHVFRALNEIAVFAAYPGHFEASFIEKALNNLVKFWTCRRHRENTLAIYNNLKETFSDNTNVSRGIAIPPPIQNQALSDDPAFRGQRRDDDDSTGESSSSTRTSREPTRATEFSQRRSASTRTTALFPGSEEIADERVQNSGQSADPQEASSSDIENRSRSDSARSVSSSLTSVSRNDTDAIYDEDSSEYPESPCPPGQRGRNMLRPVRHPQVTTERSQSLSLRPPNNTVATPSRPALPVTSTSAPHVPTRIINNIPSNDRIDFQPFLETTKSFGAISQSVFSLVRQSIRVSTSSSPRPRPRDGWIYIFQSANYPAHVKIGLTRTTPAQRGVEVASCRDLVEVRPVDQLGYVKVRNVERLEKLIHEDLANERRRFQWSCRPNTRSHDTQHREWFEMNVQEASKRVEQWREWMRQEPYGNIGELKNDFQRRIGYCEQKVHDLAKEDSDGQRWKTFMTPFYMED